MNVSPLCATFPKTISCDVPAVGASGGMQWHNGLCVLSQNIINEKIYLLLWFYLASGDLVISFFAGVGTGIGIIA